MAGPAVIGALRVVLGADTAALDKGLKDSQSGIAAFAKSVTSIAAGIGLEKILEGFVSSSINAIKHGVQLGDELNKMSQKAGVSVEELSKLKLAAELSDVPMEALGKSLGKLSKALVSAATDGAGQAGRAFAAMGVEVKNASDGSIRPSADVLTDIAEKFKGYKDGAEKTTLAIALFGKAGAALIPLLNTGRDGLKETGDQAEKFGLVLDKQAAVAAEKFMDNLKLLDAAKQGLFVTIAARLLPALEQLSEAFLESKKNSDFTATAATFVTNAIRILGTEIALTVATFHHAAVELRAIKDLLVETTSSVDFGTAAWGRFRTVTEENDKRLTDMKATLGSFSQNLDSDSFVSRFSTITTAIEGSTKETKRLQEESKKIAAPIVGEMTAAKNAIDQYIASQNKSLASQEAEIKTFGALTGQKEALKIQLQALSIATSNHTTITAAQQAQLDLLKQKTSDYALTLAGLQTTQANLSPAQLLQQEQAKINALFDAGKISAETYGEAMQKAAEKAGANWATAGAQMAGGFAELANAFSKSNKEMAVAGKAFGIFQATINTYMAFTKALASAPPPFNYVLAAGVLAAGLAKVAAISSQSTSGMMTGGAMTVRGSGGPDSVPVQFMASPGEQIDVWRPEQGGGQDPRRGAGGGNTVNLSMPIATTRDALRSLIDGLNDMFADGYRLNVVPA